MVSMTFIALAKISCALAWSPASTALRTFFTAVRYCERNAELCSFCFVVCCARLRACAEFAVSVP